MSFYEFMEDKTMWNVQTKMIAGREDIEHAKRELADYLFVGLTEKFDESLIALSKLSPHPLRLEYKRLHVTPNRDDRHEVLDDPEAYRLLHEANETDQRLYDYVCESVYPQLIESANLPVGSGPHEIGDLKHRTLRFWLSRWFQTGVYRQLVYRRRARKQRS